jgi:hypothetical protein
MPIVGAIQTTSLRRCKDLADKFRALKLTQFTGENVRAYSNSAQERLAQLERDKQLPLNHITDIVDHMSACSVMDFNIYWMGRRAAVEDFVRATMGKRKSVLAKEKCLNLQKQWVLLPALKKRLCYPRSKP